MSPIKFGLPTYVTRPATLVDEIELPAEYAPLRIGEHWRWLGAGEPNAVQGVALPVEAGQWMLPGGSKGGIFVCDRMDVAAPPWFLPGAFVALQIGIFDYLRANVEMFPLRWHGAKLTIPPQQQFLAKLDCWAPRGADEQLAADRTVRVHLHGVWGREA